MPELQTCPQQEEWMRLGLGEPSRTPLDTLLEHLETCVSCQGQAYKVVPTDGLIENLRRAELPEEGPDEAVLSQLVDRLTRLQATSKLTISCTGCGKGLKVKSELVGKKVKCPACGHVLTASCAEVATIPPSSMDEQTRPPRETPAAEVTVSRVLTRTGSQAPASGVSARAVESSDADAEHWDFLAPPELPGELGRLGPYRILKVLGRGGMGVVFQAEDPQLERVVALKAMLPALAASASAKKRFLREARTVASIKHDHIVTIHQVGEDRGAPYLAMEFLEGEPLNVRLNREAKLPLVDVIRIGRQIAEGLGAAHAKGLIHRDIKPANIWMETRPAGSDIDKQGACDFRVKILDFGLARSTSDQAGLTQSGAILGTPSYMAPEQAQGKAVDSRCDLFSLGCVLYVLGTGKLPFSGTDTLSVLMAIATAAPKSPRDLNPELPPALCDLMLRLLAKAPEDRPASALAVAEELRQMEATAPNVAPPIREVAKRRSKKWPAVLVGAMFAAVAVALAAIFYIRVETEDGEFIVEAQDDQVAVAIQKKGVLELHHRTSGKKFLVTALKSKLPAGDYELQVTDPASGLEFGTRTFSINGRGESARVRVWFKPKAETVAAPKVDPVAPKADPPVVAKQDPPPKTPDPTVDLLALIDPVRDAVHGVWRIDKNRYLTRVNEGDLSNHLFRIQIPYSPPEAYDLSLLVVSNTARGEQVHAFCIGLCGDGKPFQVILDYEGTAGLNEIHGKGPRENDTFLKLPDFPVGEPVRILVRVRKASVQVEVNQKKIIDRAGFSGFALQDVWMVPEPLALSLGYYSSFSQYEIREMTLTPVSGVGKLLYGKEWEEDPERKAIHSILAKEGAVIIEAGKQRLTLSPGSPVPHRISKLVGAIFGPTRIKDLEKFRDLPNLSFLKYPKAIDADVKLLSPQLKQLHLSGSALTDGAMPDLARLTDLTHLSLDRTRITDGGLQSLAGLEHLRELKLSHTQIKGSGLKHLAGLPALTGLELAGIKLEAAAFAHLGVIASLQELNLENTPTTDADLDQLAGLSGLVELNLRKTRVSSERLQKLREDRPGLKLFVDEVPMKGDNVLATFRREDISLEELALAGQGDPKRVPPEVVGILGDSRMMHLSPPMGVVFSPDGSWLGTVCGANIFRVWDAKTGKLLRTLPGRWAHYNNFDVCAKKKLLALSDGQGLTLYDTNSWKVVQRLPAGPSQHWIRFSPDGALAVVLEGNSKDVQIWDVATGQLRNTVVQNCAAWCAIFHPNGKYVATGEDKRVRVWDIQTGAIVADLNDHPHEGHFLSFDPQGKYLAVAGVGSHSVIVWDTSTWKLCTTIKKFNGVRIVEFLSDGRLATVGAGDPVRFWDPATGRELAKVRRQPRQPSGYDPQGPALFTTGSGRFSADGAQLATFERNSLALWDVATGNQILPLSGSTGESPSIALHPEGRRVAVATYDGVVIWDLAERKIVHKLLEVVWDPGKIQYSPNGKYLAVAGVWHRMGLWDADTGKAIAIRDGVHCWDVAFSPDSKSLAVAWEGPQAIQIIETATGRTVKTFELPPVGALAYSPDGKRLAVRTYPDELLRVIHPLTGVPLWSAKLSSPVRNLWFSSDGLEIIGAHRNEVLTTVWDAATGAVVRKFNRQTWAVRPGTNEAYGWFNLFGIFDLSTGIVRGNQVPEPNYPGGRPVAAAMSKDGIHVVIAAPNNTVHIYRFDRPHN